MPIASLNKGQVIYERSYAAERRSRLPVIRRRCWWSGSSQPQRANQPWYGGPRPGLPRQLAPFRLTRTLGETLGDRPPFGENAFDEAPVRPETLPPCKRQVRGS